MERKLPFLDKNQIDAQPDMTFKLSYLILSLFLVLFGSIENNFDVLCLMHVSLIRNKQLL